MVGAPQAGYPAMHPYAQSMGMMSPPAVDPGMGQNLEPLKPFDSGKMKAGRMGHYGYLEGRGQ